MRAVDELGIVQAQIAELRAQEKELKGWILEQDQLGMETEGEFFKAIVIQANRVTTNWKKIATDLGASFQKIRANSKTTEVVTIKVTARSTTAQRVA